MCWSAEVSYAFTLLEVLLLCTLWMGKASRPYAKCVTPLFITVIIVELCEAFSWPYVVDLADRLANNTACPYVNRVFTSIIYVAIRCQPVCATLIAVRAPKEAEHPYGKELRFLFGLSAITLLCDLVSVAVTMITDENDRLYEVNGYGDVPLPRGWSYVTTCSYKGPHGHQLWGFAWSNKFHDVFPNNYPYFLFSLPSILLVYDKVEGVAWICFMSSFVIMFFGWNGGEAASTWCFAAISMLVFYNIFPCAKAYFGIRTITSWRDFISREQMTSVGAADGKKVASSVIDSGNSEISACTV